MGVTSNPNCDEEVYILPEVASQVCNWMRNGISKEEKAEILKLVPRKCKNFTFKAPKVNEELEEFLKDEVKKKDKFSYHHMDLLGATLSLSATNFSMILNDKNEPIDREVLLQNLSDSLKLQAQLFNLLVMARKVYICPCFSDNYAKKALFKAEPTEFLFGDNVQEIVNKINTIEKIGKTLTKNDKKKPFQKSQQNNSLNWAGSSERNEVNRRNPKYRQYLDSRSAGYKPFSRPFNRNNQNQRGAHRRPYIQAEPMQFNKKK